MPEYSKPEFGEAVRRVLQEHGLTLRAQRIRTGIDHTTMKSMCDGIPGRLEKIEQFARAFSLDLNEWRRLAGYEPVEDATCRQAVNALDWFMEQFRRIQQAYPHLFIPLPSFQGGAQNLTMLGAEKAIRAIEEGIAEGIFEPRPVEKG